MLFHNTDIFAHEEYLNLHRQWWRFWHNSADESSLSLLGVETSVSAIDGDSDCETGVPVVARTGGTGVPGWPTGVVGACKIMVTGAGSGT
ncbi:hypothetical protein PS15p_209439 [Mucor circinelloides]